MSILDFIHLGTPPLCRGVMGGKGMFGAAVLLAMLG